MRGIASVGLCASTVAVGAAMVSASSGASAVRPHATMTYTRALVATKQREIWPYVDGTRFTVTNVSLTQQPMYRPLYWFGLGSSTTFQPTLSLATAPVFSNANKTVTIHLKGWVYYNANTNKTEQIQAKNIAFWFNLAKAEPGGYGGYTPGYGIPDQIASTKVVNPLTFQINLKSAVNTNWFLYNSLATVTPLPTEWDTNSLTAYHFQNCEGGVFGAASTNTACTNVYNAFSDDTNGFAADNTLPIWHVYSGPYMLSKYVYSSDPSVYDVEMVPNTHFSGHKATVNIHFRFFADLTSEETTLQTTTQLSAGAADPTLVTTAPKPGTAGVNKVPFLVSHYKVTTGGFWGFDYAYINFGGHAVHQHLLNQQYIRAAMIQAVNQPGIVKTIYNNYAVTSCSPLPKLNDPFATGTVCPYPYNPTAAKSKLTTNGWTVPSSGAATCTRSTGCGAGIPKGTKLNLTFEYITSAGSPFNAMVASEQSQWAKVGINVTLDGTDEGTVSNDCLNGTATASTYDICEYGGWVYSPGAYPSGEQLFIVGAASNDGFVSFANIQNDIKSTITTSTSLHKYDQDSANTVIVLYQPSALGVGELAKTVVGAQPPNPISDFNPEYITAT
jgi:peptide/nickel transport system substrate-binding protein